MAQQITCGCDGNPYTYNSYKAHIKTSDHAKWVKTEPDHLDQVYIQCDCGVHYNYKTAHNHFRSKPHRDWELSDLKRHDAVLILCVCGEVIKYGERQSHNKGHID